MQTDVVSTNHRYRVARQRDCEHTRVQKSGQETTEVHGAVDRITEWGVIMDYETMKAFMEASRAESPAQRKLQVREFPKPDSKPDWKYLNQVPKEGMAAKR